MKRVVTILGIIAALCALFSGCGAKREVKTDCSGLVSCTYSSAGGMSGGYYYLTLSREGDDWTVTMESKEHNGAEEVTEKYAVPERAARDLEEYFSWHDCESWKELEVDTDMIAYDAPTASVSFQLEDGRAYSVRGPLKMPKGEEMLCYEVSSFLESYTAEAAVFELSTGTADAESCSIVFSKPEMVDCEIQLRPEGVVYLLRGRIPGELTASVKVDGKAKAERYTITVDKDYNVSAERGTR